jgi:hypothetical protein
MVSACLAIGVVIGLVLRRVASVWLPRLRSLPPASTDTVNFFHGVVFPAPHDPRWRSDRGSWLFSDGPGLIVVAPRPAHGEDFSIDATIYIGGSFIDSGRNVRAYWTAIERAQEDLGRQLRLAFVEPAILSEPLPRKKEAPPIPETTAAVPAMFPPPERTADERLLLVPRADDPRWKATSLGNFIVSRDNHSLLLFENGSIYIDGQEWIRHPSLKDLHHDLRARLGVVAKPNMDAIAIEMLK